MRWRSLPSTPQWCYIIPLAVRPSPTLWHQWLGHPGSFALQQVLSQNKLLVASSNNHASVCNACQMAKSHQLLFHDSNNHSSSQLQLMHTNVWDQLFGHPVAIAIMSVLLTMLVDFHGSMSSSTSLMFIVSFENFKPMLNTCLIQKF
jgi:hypothetical protein